jgi:RNA polymerase sigma-70 factor (ECF subfamily)
LWRFGYVLSNAKDVADDLVQATCVRAIERRHQFVEGSRLDAWAFSILSSIWKNQLRAEKIRTGQGFADPETTLIFNGVHATETNIFLRQVLNKVMALPEAQRTTVLLVYGDGLSYQDAADVLDIPIGTVMSRLAAARKSLADLKDSRSGKEENRK